MTYEAAKRRCAVRESIWRLGDPLKVFTEGELAKLHPALQALPSNRARVGTLVPKRYPKNHPVPLDERAPDADKARTDWAVYDPRENPMSSRHNETPA